MRRHNVETEALREMSNQKQALLRVQEVTQRRSISTMDPVWSAGYNAALAVVSEALKERFEGDTDYKVLVDTTAELFEMIALCEDPSRGGLETVRKLLIENAKRIAAFAQAHCYKYRRWQCP